MFTLTVIVYIMTSLAFGVAYYSLGEDKILATIRGFIIPIIISVVVIIMWFVIYGVIEAMIYIVKNFP